MSQIMASLATICIIEQGFIKLWGNITEQQNSTSNSPRDASTRGKPDHLDEGHSAHLLE